MRELPSRRLLAAGALALGMRETLASTGPVLLAFLASQHHTLHMLILTFGVGTAGMSFLTMYPVIRRVMLLASLLVAGAVAYQATREARRLHMRVMSGLSVATTLVLVAWSVGEFGVSTGVSRDGSDDRQPGGREPDIPKNVSRPRPCDVVLSARSAGPSVVIRLPRR